MHRAIIAVGQTIRAQATIMGYADAFREFQRSVFVRGRWARRSVGSAATASGLEIFGGTTVGRVSTRLLADGLHRAASFGLQHLNFTFSIVALALSSRQNQTIDTSTKLSLRYLTGATVVQNASSGHLHIMPIRRNSLKIIVERRLCWDAAPRGGLRRGMKGRDIGFVSSGADQADTL
jgi:hypothetical protein